MSHVEIQKLLEQQIRMLYEQSEQTRDVEDLCKLSESMACLAITWCAISSLL